jgi:hypothetical protein
MLLALTFFLRGLYMNKPFLAALVILTGTSIFNIFLGKDEPVQLFKQSFGIFQNAIFYYMIVKANGFRVERLFRMYLSLCAVVCGFGLIQEVAFIAGIEPVYNLKWLIPTYRYVVTSGIFLRISSITPEPSYMGFVLMPAAFASAHALFDPARKIIPNWMVALFLATLVFTFSSIAYIGLAITLLLMVINFRKFKYLAAISVVLPILALLAYTHVRDFQVRVDGSQNLIQGTASLEESDLSNFALFSNMEVAFRSFSENPLIGSGLGSHTVSYNRHIGNIINLDRMKLLLNQEDANSLGLRLISETGLLGTGLFLAFAFMFMLTKSRDGTSHLWIINNAILAMILVKFIRFGHYFENGFFLFFWMYYASYTRGREASQEQEESFAAPMAPPPA